LGVNPMRRLAHPDELQWHERICHAEQLLTDAEYAMRPDVKSVFSFAHVSKLTTPERPQLIQQEPEASDLGKEWALVRHRDEDFGPCMASNLALHEAGHFTVAMAVLDPGSLVSASVGLRKMGGLTLHSGRYLPCYAKDKHVPRLAVLAAGTLAEFVAQGRTWEAPLKYPAGDWLGACEILGHLPTAQANALHAQTQKHALQILCNRWDSVLEVARALMKRGSHSAMVGK
ncbi:hypothetical protein, partial [Hydrogenophaga sp.]|uniref:hypothetical protein n=1 Tax=Hydrogenophaga sp. TaxID=1904254 RepID=UPI002715DA5E